MLRPLLLSLLIVLALLSCRSSKTATKSTPSAATVGTDIEALIAQMTIEEKVGQMTQLNLDVVLEGEIYQSVEPHHIQADLLRKALVEKHVGSMLNVGGHAYPLSQWRELMDEIQTVATTESRLKIPVLYGIDAIHGANYLMEGTLFPQPLAQAATFDPALVEEAARITAYETRASGIPWNFSPVLDLGRQPLWSRMFETYGEDVHLAKTMGDAAIRGYQGEDPSDPYRVSACMKHFLGYSWSYTGKDRTPVYIHERQLREYYLPTFESAIETGALSVMINSGELNGIPVHADKAILTDLLRDELGFEGVAVTDWEDIIKLRDNHRVAATLKDAVEMAVMAGIDMSMTPNDYDFTDLLIELVKEGRVPESRLDISVRRILRMKEQLRLFDRPLSYRLVDYPLVGSTAHDEVSYQTAKDALTLLKNDADLLPLKSPSKLIVTGPSANSMTMLNGAWSRTWQGTDATYDDAEKKTIVEALSDRFPGKVVHVSLDSAEEMPTALRQIEAEATFGAVIIYCLGEMPSTEKPGDIDDLSFDQWQLDMVSRTASIARPKVALLVENRPRLISAIDDELDAVIMAYQPADEGGRAIAALLAGDYSPNGRLPITYPRHANTLLTYDHKYTEALDTDFSFNAFDPQYEFGHGLSYTSVDYSPIQMSADTISGDERIRLSVRLTNRSADYEQKESVLLFIRDHVASITPSVKKMVAFDKLLLAPGESKEVAFELKRADLSFIGIDMERITEAGAFDVMIGQEKATFWWEE